MYHVAYIFQSKTRESRVKANSPLAIRNGKFSVLLLLLLLTGVLALSGVRWSRAGNQGGLIDRAIRVVGARSKQKNAHRVTE